MTIAAASNHKASNTMALSLYDLSVPVFTRGLGQLTHLLDKSLAHVKANGIDPATLVDARLAPDMLTLTGQIQRASDASKLGTARIAGIAAPSFPDEEKTWDDLVARIAKTQDFLNSVDRSQIDGQEERAVTIKAREGEAHHRAALPAAVRAAQFLLPCDHGLRRAAPQRHADRQDGLPRQVLRSAAAAFAPQRSVSDGRWPPAHHAPRTTRRRCLSAPCYS